MSVMATHERFVEFAPGWGTWHASCSCGWAGGPAGSRAESRAQHDEHVAHPSTVWEPPLILAAEAQVPEGGFERFMSWLGGPVIAVLTLAGLFWAGMVSGGAW